MRRLIHLSGRGGGTFTKIGYYGNWNFLIVKENLVKHSGPILLYFQCALFIIILKIPPTILRNCLGNIMTPTNSMFSSTLKSKLTWLVIIKTSLVNTFTIYVRPMPIFFVSTF